MYEGHYRGRFCRFRVLPPIFAGGCFLQIPCKNGGNRVVTPVARVLPMGDLPKALYGAVSQKFEVSGNRVTYPNRRCCRVYILYSYLVTFFCNFSVIKNNSGFFYSSIGGCYPVTAAARLHDRRNRADLRNGGVYSIFAAKSH